MPKNETVREQLVKKARSYPNNFEAEQSMLCCILIDGDAANCISKLSVKSFYNAKNQKIFKAMQALKESDTPIDIITVYDYMETNGLSDEQTLQYLTTLNNLLPSGANYRQYLDMLTRDLTLRSIITMCNAILEQAYSSSNADEVVQFAEQRIFELAKERSRNELRPISTATIEVMDRIERLKKDRNSMRGLTTGFPIFDRVTNGLQNGDLIILAARPSVGKTAFALNIIANAVENHDKQKCIAIFSLEMPARQIAQRIMSRMGSVSMVDMNSAMLKSNGDAQLWKVTQKLSNSKVYINDSSLVTPSEVISQCRRLAIEENDGRIDLVVIDYLQLMTCETGGRSDGNREQEIGRMSRMMKVMARELDCPVILLSQMSRAIESRTDKTPQLSDLRESGTIEQDADLVMFLSREVEKEKHNSPIILDLLKHRNGELKKIRLNWQGEFMKFTESDDQREYLTRPKAVIDVSADSESEE